MQTPTDEVKIVLAREMDLPGILKVERKTFGSWDEPVFRNMLSQRRTVCYVAIYKDSLHRDRVIGFIVMELGYSVLRVLNMAATWPAARKKLIDLANERAVKHKVYLSFVG